MKSLVGLESYSDFRTVHAMKSLVELESYSEFSTVHAMKSLVGWKAILSSVQYVQ